MVNIKTSHKADLSILKKFAKEYKERQTYDSRKKNSKDIDWYQWKEKNKIRILPPWSSSGEIFKLIQYHYGLPPSNKSQQCLRLTWDRQCYICTAFGRMWTKDSKYDFKWRTKAYANCIDRDNLAAGVQVVALPMSVFNWIIQMVDDEEVGDVSDANKGSDIMVLKEKTGDQPKDVKYIPSLWVRDCVLSKDKEQAEEWLSNLYDLDSIFRSPRESTFQANLEAANAFLNKYGLRSIDPNNLSEEDKYVLELELPSGNGGKKDEEEEEEEDVERKAAEYQDSDQRSECFGNYDKDNEECLVCPDSSDCYDQTSGVG